RLCLDYIERLAVWRETHTVGDGHRMHHFADGAAIDAGVENAAAVHCPAAQLSRVGEVEAALAIEHQVVRPPQQAAVAAFVDSVVAAAAKVHALDRSARVV